MDTESKSEEIVEDVPTNYPSLNEYLRAKPLILSLSICFIPATLECRVELWELLNAEQGPLVTIEAETLDAALSELDKSAYIVAKAKGRKKDEEAISNS